jgi:hypothetical protein
MRKLSWISNVELKCHYQYSYKRQTDEYLSTEKEKKKYMEGKIGVWWPQVNECQKLDFRDRRWRRQEEILT